MQTVVTPKIRWVFIFQGPEARKRGFLREAGHGDEHAKKISNL